MKTLYEDPDPDAMMFWAPVNLSECPTYRKLIKNPMDLGNVSKRVRAGYYGTDIESFSHDVRLVWKNCLKFYVKNDDIITISNKLSCVFEEQYEKIINNESLRPLLEDIV